MTTENNGYCTNYCTYLPYGVQYIYILSLAYNALWLPGFFLPKSLTKFTRPRGLLLVFAKKRKRSI